MILRLPGFVATIKALLFAETDYRNRRNVLLVVVVGGPYRGSILLLLGLELRSWLRFYLELRLENRWWRTLQLVRWEELLGMNFRLLHFYLRSCCNRWWWQSRPRNRYRRNKKMLGQESDGSPDLGCFLPIAQPHHAQDEEGLKNNLILTILSRTPQAIQ